MKSKEVLLGIAGGPGTGKSMVGEHLRKAHGITVDEGSEILKAIAKKQKRQLSAREEYIRFFRQQQALCNDMSWLSDLTIRRKESRVAQIGVRCKYDAENIQNNGGIIIALTCDPEICIGRIDTSNPKNPKTLEEYAEHMALDNSSDELGTHLDKVIEEADVTIETSEPREAVFATLEEIVAAHVGRYAIL